MAHHILVVDDDQLVRQSIKEVLEFEGHIVDIAANGYEAEKLFSENNPEVVITDILMPDKDGLEVILDIKKMNKETKIIAISGGGRIGAKDHLYIAMRLGANSTLTKPFSSYQLLSAIEDLYKEEKKKCLK